MKLQLSVDAAFTSSRGLVFSLSTWYFQSREVHRTAIQHWREESSGGLMSPGTPRSSAISCGGHYPGNPAPSTLWVSVYLPIWGRGWALSLIKSFSALTLYHSVQPALSRMPGVPAGHGQRERRLQARVVRLWVAVWGVPSLLAEFEDWFVSVGIFLLFNVLGKNEVAIKLEMLGLFVTSRKFGLCKWSTSLSKFFWVELYCSPAKSSSIPIHESSLLWGKWEGFSTWEIEVKGRKLLYEDISILSLAGAALRSI